METRPLGHVNPWRRFSPTTELLRFNGDAPSRAREHDAGGAAVVTDRLLQWRRALSAREAHR